MHDFYQDGLAENHKRPGEGAQEHKIFPYLGCVASQRKRMKQSEENHITKCTWNLNTGLLGVGRRDLEGAGCYLMKTFFKS